MFVELYLLGKDQSMQRSSVRNDFVSLLKTLGLSVSFGVQSSGSSLRGGDFTIKDQGRSSKCLRGRGPQGCLFKTPLGSREERRDNEAEEYVLDTMVCHVQSRAVFNSTQENHPLRAWT